MKNISRLLIASLFCLPFLSGCAGTRNSLTMEKLEYPVSMSPALYGARNEILVKGQELRTVGTISYEKTFWGTLYSLLSFSNDDDIAQEINRKVKAKGGVGVVNFSATSKNCTINKMTFLTYIPIWPSCTDSLIEGEIVAVKASE